MLFISHSTKDKAEALKLHALLLERGYDPKQLFLDSDEQSGIGAGEKWKQVLYEQLKDCHVLIVLCSPNWKASQWCFAEFVYADMNGKEIFPAVIADGDIGSIASEHQSVFVTKEGDKAYERLFAALEAKQFGPKDHLSWPHPDLKDDNGQPDECPFPGLLAFDERYAAVYFGREPEIQTFLEQLNEMRRKGEPRLLMIVGGSGSGKSSLLKAGVLPRLTHRSSDTEWLVLPTLRYGDFAHGDNAFFQALAEHVADRYPASASNKPDTDSLREQFSNPNVDQAAEAFWESAHKLSRACDCKEAAVLVAIDQFEELLSPSSGEMAAKFLRFLKATCQRPNRRFLVIGTMRSDYLDVYEHHESALQAPLFKPWRLEPFPRERLEDVITKPAARVHVEVASDLREQLKKDTPTADALPLLAFTLEKLFRQCANDQLIELHEYEKLGGMTGAISQAVARILPQDLPKETEHALRLSFVKHLAQVNEKDEFVRRPARWSDLPAAAKPLLEQFVRERLLHRSGSTGELIEVSHEALFRSWDQLTKWLNESSRILRWRRDVEHDRNAAPDSWTGLSRSQLVIARKWPKERPDELSPDEITWVRQAILREQLSRLAQLTVLVTILALSTLGGIARYQKELAEKATLRETRIQTARQLASQSRDNLETNPQLSLLLAVEATRVTSTDDVIIPAAEQALRNVLSEVGGVLLMGSGKPVKVVTTTPDKAMVATIDSAGESRVWDLNNLSEGPTILQDLSSPISAMAFSRSGKLAIGCADGRIRIRDADLRTTSPKSGDALAANHSYEGSIRKLVFSSSGEQLASAGSDGMVRIENVFDPKATPLEFKGDDFALLHLDSLIATLDEEKTLRVWEFNGTESKLEPLSEHPNVVWMQVSPSEPSHLVVVIEVQDLDQTVRWRIKRIGRSSSEIAEVVHTDAFSGLNFAVSPDERWLVAGLTDNADGIVYLWDLNKPNARPTIVRHPGNISALGFVSQDAPQNSQHAPQYSLLVTIADATIRLWNLGDGVVVGTNEPLPITLRGHEKSLRNGALTFLNWPKMVTGGSDGIARLWSLEDPFSEPRLLDRARATAALSLSKTSSEGSLVEAKFAMVRSRVPLQSEALSADGKLKATVHLLVPDEVSCVIRLGNTAGVATKADTLPIPDIDPPLKSPWLVFSTDSSRLAASDDRRILVWSTTNRSRAPVSLRVPEKIKPMNRCLALSSDGKQLAAGCDDGRIVIWRDVVAGGEPKVIDLGVKEEFAALSFSPSGELLAVAGRLGHVFLCSTKQINAKVAVLSAPRSSGDLLAFSPCGRRLVAVTNYANREDAKMFLWDVERPTFEPVELRRPRGTIDDVGFSSDGKWLAAGSYNGTLRIWSMTTEGLMERAREVVVRNLKLDEWQTYFPGKTHRPTFEYLPFP